MLPRYVFARDGCAVCSASLAGLTTHTWFLQINATSHFTNDLGLDSLDTVEVVMAIEEVNIRDYCACGS